MYYEPNQSLVEVNHNDGIIRVAVNSSGKLRIGERHVATAQHCKGRWGCGRPGQRFRCFLCGYKFVVDDIFLWLYTNDTEAPGNPLICLGCELQYTNSGSDDLRTSKPSALGVHYRWQSVYHQAHSYWWMEE